MIAIEEITTANIPGISQGTALYLCESALTCFQRHNHQSGVSMACQGIDDQQETVVWTTPFTDQMDRSFNDQEVATEHSAACISILYALHHTGYTVIQRARKKTGVDYWLGKKDDLLFQNAARMEVSGIFNDPNGVSVRVRKKVNQSRQSDGTTLPAYISVVEFSQPSINFIRR